MARPKKSGLGYFPFETDFFRDRKIKRLRRTFGDIGVSVYLFLLTEIYRDRGYYIPYEDELVVDVANELGVDEALVKDVIEKCISYGLFDSAQYKTNRILTSKGVQERYFTAIKRDRKVSAIEKYILRETGVFPGETQVNPGKTQVNHGETQVYPHDNPTKEKKRKEKKRNKLNKGTGVNIHGDFEEGVEGTAVNFDAGACRELVDFGAPAVLELRKQVAWIFRDSITETRPILPELIDRITAGIYLKIPRFTLGDCRTVAREANQAVEDFANPYKPGVGREHRWQTINIRFGEFCTRAGGEWPPFDGGGIEPSPVNPAEEIKNGEEKRPTKDELLSIVQGRPYKEGEDLDATAARLKIPLGEAVCLRNAWRQLQKHETQTQGAASE